MYMHYVDATPSQQQRAHMAHTQLMWTQLSTTTTSFSIDIQKPCVSHGTQEL